MEKGAPGFAKLGWLKRLNTSTPELNIHMLSYSEIAVQSHVSLPTTKSREPQLRESVP
jgi:hypothetical protein